MAGEGYFGLLVMPEALARGFARVRANGGGPGGDGETAAAFGRDLSARLARLAADLRSGRYRPGRLRCHAIAKPSGGVRLLRIPAIADRVVQTAAATLLAARLDGRMSRESFGYRPARSVAEALARVRAHASGGSTWALDADIARFFDEVPHDRLLDDLAIWTGDDRLVALVSLWLDGFARSGPEPGRARGLAQGAPVSPVLANLFLHPLDAALARAGFAHVRYADDFVVLARDAPGALRARAVAAAALARRGLALRREKTAIVAPGTPFAFLGASLSLGLRGAGAPAKGC